VGGRRAVLSIDTGMLRLGLSPAEVSALADDPALLAGVEIDYLMSHLACAEDRDSPVNERQYELFNRLRAALPPAKTSLSNSAGIFLAPRFHQDLCRPGAALFGVSRSTGAPAPMRQVVGLKAKILQIRNVDTESTVGYGASSRVPAGARLATVAAGYADGLLRALSNRGHGYAGGIEVPIIGRVSMDLITFDISAVPEDAVAPGDYIDLLCDRHTVDDLADEAGTIGYEILTALGQRYRRIYTGGPDS
jgi:alanine racemase